MVVLCRKCFRLMVLDIMLLLLLAVAETACRVGWSEKAIRHRERQCVARRD